MSPTAMAGVRGLGRVVAWLALVLGTLWAATALTFRFGLPTRLAPLLFAAAMLALIFVRAARRRVVVGLLAGIAVAFLLIMTMRARTDRDWWTETSRVIQLEQDGPMLHVDGIRDFEWRTVDDFDPRWVRRSYDLRRLETMELVVEPFAGIPVIAHTFLSFGFDDGQYLSISIEARKERGEDYGLLPGLFRQFELYVVVGEERDLLTTRAVARNSELYAYPIRASEAFKRSLLLQLLEDAAGLGERPRFYHSLRHNCTTELFLHADRLLDRSESIPIGIRILLPGLAPLELYERGLIETDLDFEATRQQHRIDEAVRRWVDDAHFSQRIRGRADALKVTSPEAPGAGEAESTDAASAVTNAP